MTEDRSVRCRSGGVSRYLCRLIRECWEGAWPWLAWKLTSLGGATEAEPGFLCRKIKSPLMVLPEVPLLSPGGKYKVRQTRVSLSSWECGIGGKCSDLLNCRNMEQRELVWREKTSS